MRRIEQLHASIARMIARTHSATLLGVNAVEMEIECNEADGNQFRCTIVGLPDLAVKEARDRVLAAVRNGQSTPLVFKRLSKAPDTSRVQDPKRPYPYQEEEVQFANASAGIQLAGTFTFP